MRSVPWPRGLIDLDLTATSPLLLGGQKAREGNPRKRTISPQGKRND